jgi:hypothetical protein
MKDADIQIGLINVVVGGALLWLLVMERSLLSLENLFFWLATITFLIHWYWGLIAYVKYVGPTQQLAEFFVDILAVGLQVSTIFWINFPTIWFVLNAASFLMAVCKYLLSLRLRALSAPIKLYIREKLQLHSVGIIGMLIGAVATFLTGNWWLLGLITLLAHLAALWFLIAKRVYEFKEAEA